MEKTYLTNVTKVVLYFEIQKRLLVNSKDIYYVVIVFQSDCKIVFLCLCLLKPTINLEAKALWIYVH